MITFRHSCPPDVNPKHVVSDQGTSVRSGAYSEHLRREYEVPADVEWHLLYDTPADLARLGIAIPNGRKMAVVACPDCGVDVVVTTDADKE